MPESDHHAQTYHSNPFRSLMSQLSYVLKANPISVLTLGLLMLVVILGGVFFIALFAGLFNSVFGNILAVMLGIAYVVLVLFRFTAASYHLQLVSREGRELTAMQALDESSKKNFNTFILTALATEILILLGLIAFIVPGLYLIGRLVFAPYVALNEGLGVVASLKRSWKLSDGHWFEVFGVIIASAVAIPSGLLAFAGGQAGVAGRYIELSHLEKTGGKKSETHWMNYLLTTLAIIFAIVYIAVVKEARKTANGVNDFCVDNSSSIFCDTNDNSNNRSMEDIYNSTPAN